MDKLEKVISGLECCKDPMITGIKCNICPYWDDNNPDEYQTSCNDNLCADALELLKKQQPMLIDVNQMKQLADGTDVWLEAKDDGEVFALTVARAWVGYYFDGVENGKYRCWTARPTDEQRKSVPWSDA